MPKVKNRTRWVTLRVKPEEYDYIRREAEERGQRPSEYVRAVLFAAANFHFSVEEKKT